jgi:parallel beta-helix repeat protein
MRNVRSLLAVIVLSLVSGATLWLLPTPSHADTRAVNCTAGQKIGSALILPAGSPLIITIRGTCNENVSIGRDNVTLQGDPVAGGTINGPDTTRASVFVGGAQGIVIQQLTVIGGFHGIHAQNGAAVTVQNATVQGAAQNGVVANLGASVVVDHSVIQNNGNLLSTNPAVGRNGLAISDNAAGIVTNSTIVGNASNGVFVGRGSSARIGKTLVNAPGPNAIQGNGSSGVFVLGAAQAMVHGNAIQNNTGNGISVEGGHVTITANQILNNGKDSRGGFLADSNGISVSIAAGARVGYDDSGVDAGNGNAISGNTLDGILVANTADANIRGNTISGNGRRGLDVGRGTARLLGNNTISGNATEGVLVSLGQLFQGQGDFAFGGFRDVITGNGTYGVQVVGGASADLRNVEVSNNGFDGIGVFEGATLQLRSDDLSAPVNRSVVRNNGTNTTQGNRHGVDVFNGSSASIRDVTIQSNAFRGISVSTGSALDLRGSIVDSNGGDGVGVFTGSAAFISSISDSVNGLRTTSITNNGLAGPAFFFGINLSNSATGEIHDTTVSGNSHGGINMDTNSTLVIRNNSATALTTIRNNLAGAAGAGDGIRVFNGSFANLGASGNPLISITGNAHFAINCFTGGRIANFNAGVANGTNNGGGAQFGATAATTPVPNTLSNGYNSCN